MKRISFVLIAVITNFSIACNLSYNNEATKIAALQDTVAKIDFSNIVFASQKDTVCHMPLSVGVEDTLHFEGKVYGFCSAGCKNVFAAQLLR